MIRPRSALRLLLAASVALPLAWGAPAAAGEAPAPAGRDRLDLPEEDGAITDDGDGLRVWVGDDAFDLEEQG